MNTPEQKRRRRRLLVTAAAVVLAAGAALLLLAVRKNGETAAAPQFTLHTVQAVITNPLIEATGNLQAVESQDIGFAGTGKVAAVHVKEKDRVFAGALIAELDSSKERYDLANLDFSIQKARISGSESQLALLQLERQMKLAELEAKKVWTTISGQVSAVEVRVGEYVKTGDSIKPIARIIDLSAMRAVVEIDELDVPRLAVGQAVRFHIDALPGLGVTGRVSNLPLEGRITSQGIAVLDAELMIDAPPKELLPGYSFAAEIVAGDEQTLLLLDSNAVVQRAGKTLVLMPPEAAGERPTPRELRTAPYDSARVQVLAGLSEGDTVVVPALGWGSGSRPSSPGGSAGAGGGSSGGNASGGSSAPAGSAQQTAVNPLSLFGIPQRGPGMGPPPGGQR